MRRRSSSLLRPAAENRAGAVEAGFAGAVDFAAAAAGLGTGFWVCAAAGAARDATRPQRTSTRTAYLLLECTMKYGPGSIRILQRGSPLATETSTRPHESSSKAVAESEGFCAKKPRGTPRIIIYSSQAHATRYFPLTLCHTAPGRNSPSPPSRPLDSSTY